MFWYIFVEMFDVYTNLINWCCDIHIQCGSHVCSVIYANVDTMLYKALIRQLTITLW